MKQYLNLWKELKEEISVKNIIDAFLGSFVYTLILSLPIFLAIAQVISVYFYLLTFWVVLIIIVVALLNGILHMWWKKALYLKQPEIITNIKRLFCYNQIILDVVYLIIGLLFIFVFIPMWLV
ncbi:MAG: hypothetical protein RQ856_01500 [Candidatus Izemoplasmatales bacterium]|nr:hypothetical protein [Candidatus Izemoplasmatales bacterium]